jgi:hypothetical protein
MVMTIVTGVSSPWILGKPTAKETAAKARAFADDLGIESL